MHQQNPLLMKLATNGGDENNGCDYVSARPLRPGTFWVRVDGVPGFAVELRHGLEGDCLQCSHADWPREIKTLSDADGRVEWFLYPEQYLTVAQITAAGKQTADILAKL